MDKERIDLSKWEDSEFCVAHDGWKVARHASTAAGRCTCVEDHNEERWRLTMCRWEVSRETSGTIQSWLGNSSGVVTGQKGNRG